MIDVARRTASVAGLDMTAEYGRAAGDNGAPDLRLGNGHLVRGEISRATAPQSLGQAQVRDHAGRSVRRQVEQFQWRGGPGDVAMGEMEIAHGGRDMTVAKQSL